MTRNENAELIRRLKECKDIIQLESGHWYFWQTPGTGAIRADQLRAIADELDRLNAKEKA